MRLVPRSAGQLLRASATIALTALAIAWLEPTAGALAFLAALIAVMLPILFVPVLQGLDLRVRTHVGALTRFSFDALLGIAPVRAHVAQSSIGVEHEGLLVEWAAASYRLLRWRVLVDGLQMVIGISMAAWILLTHASHATDATGVLLLAYWALNIPALGDEIASLVHQYPSYRNITLRLLEPLGTPEQVPVASGSHEGRSERVDSPIGSCRQGDRSAAAVELKNVTVRAGGHTILDSLDLELPAHSHVAIVGPSGAGKSSLVGLLLGWHRATSGQVFVDGKVLDADRLTELRSGTVWIDPSVQLWNRSMLENLLYGNAESNFDLVSDAVHQADLYDVLQRLPDGLQMRLGESGGLLSGGEGQRIRFGRGLARGVPRLVIMDEPFRGLERSRRHELLQRATSRWKDATLIFITHDVGETLEFPRVLVIDCGRLVEDAAPDQLRERPGSLYRSLLDAEVAVRDGLWASKLWRRTKLRSGSLRDVKEEPSS